MRHAWIACALALSGLTAPAMAQQTLDNPISFYQPYRVDSGVVRNVADEPAVVFETVVGVKEAAWLRLYFGEAILDRGSFVRVTSLHDHDYMDLDVRTMIEWDRTSAYFNGNALLVQLFAGPRTTNNRITIEQVELEPGEARYDRGTCGICGPDDRVPSDEDFAGRLVPVGCSATIWNQHSCVVSAGHCYDGNNVMQFRVPASNPDCSINHPPATEQFPMTNEQWNNGGVGNDWQVGIAGTNFQGQQPYDRYGVFRPIKDGPPVSGPVLTIWGYGIDDQCTRSSTQQTSSGSLASISSTYFNHFVDATFGNSGSGVQQSGEIVGIATHCPCPNVATRMDHPAFEAAREDVCPSGYCSATANSTGGEYIANVSLNTIDNSSGSDGYSDFTDISTTLQMGVEYELTVTPADSGNFTIGGVWIDWNFDEDFDDPGETIVDEWAGSGLYATSFFVPGDAVEMTTRMRIRVQNFNDDPTPVPCGDTTFGEVEDYSVEVTPLPNDDCNSATAINNGSHPYGTIGATTDGPDETESCNFAFDSGIEADVWFRYLAPCDGTVTVDLCDSDFDTRVAIYAGLCPSEPNTAIACDDDGCGQQSIVSFEAAAGQLYLIRVGSGSGETGAGTLVIDCEEIQPTCPEDINGDDVVNVFDLLELLDAWGPCPGCPADLDDNDVVNVFDLLILLDAWGPC